MAIFDISPTLTESSAVWPGDVRLSRKVQMRLADGDSVELSCLTTTVHIGAHADAPSHYHKEGVSIDQVGLEAYIGPCQVIHRLGCKVIRADDLKGITLEKGDRLLFRTQVRINSASFDENFAYFEPEAVDIMGAAGIVLIGIDTPSVDHFHSKGMQSHLMLYKHRMANLEGLDLSAIPEGRYELIAPPLKLGGFDGSPLRALLRTL